MKGSRGRAPSLQRRNLLACESVQITHEGSVKPAKQRLPPQLPLLAMKLLLLLLWRLMPDLSTV
jgi:hypothetical protein